MTQIDRLKLRTGCDDEAKLLALLSGARGFILAYTGRTSSEWLECFDWAQITVALVDYNRQGIEGFKSRKEGEIATESLGSDDYPKSVMSALNRYRLAGVV